ATTFNNNSANENGGAIYNFGVSGDRAYVRVNSCSFNRNSAPLVGGVFNASLDDDVPGGFFDLGNSVFKAGALGANVGDTRWLFSRGYNLSSDAAGGDDTTGPGGF